MLHFEHIDYLLTRLLYVTISYLQYFFTYRLKNLDKYSENKPTTPYSLTTHSQQHTIIAANPPILVKAKAQSPGFLILFHTHVPKYY